MLCCLATPVSQVGDRCVFVASQNTLPASCLSSASLAKRCRGCSLNEVREYWHLTLPFSAFVAKLVRPSEVSFFCRYTWEEIVIVQLEIIKMSIDKYDPIRVLGEGSFGKVYLMRDKVRRTFVCVKVIKIKNIPKKEREATKMEVDLLRRLHHPNIVRYIDSFLSKNNESLCICMEYCDGVSNFMTVWISIRWSYETRNI